MGEQSPGAAACPAGVGLCILSSGSAGGATGSAGVLQQEGRSGHGKVLGTGKSLEGNSPRRDLALQGGEKQGLARMGKWPEPSARRGARSPCWRGEQRGVGFAFARSGWDVQHCFFREQITYFIHFPCKKGAVLKQ